MENDSEEYIPPGDEGGPTKNFLEHLEDLRWVLMKCVVAVGIAFLVCLFASPVLVKILTRPLKQANLMTLDNVPSVTFYIGTNRVGTYNLETNQSATYLFGTNLHAAVELAPITVGSNQVLGLTVRTNEAQVASENAVDLRNFGPASAFMLAVQMALYGGIALASPFLFYFIGQFVFPALKIREKKYTYRGLAFGFTLFAIGVAFCYFILMPVALRASVQYSEWMGFRATDWRAEEYMSFVSKFLLGMGLGFELPVVLLVLVKIGILDYRTLASMRRYMIVICLVLGAILTTPEVITQILMAVPLYLLYEITIWIAWYWERQEKKRLAEEEKES